MPYYDNPAGRLHDLLTRLAQQKQSLSLCDSWAAVLGVDPGDVVIRLGQVADLVRQTQDAVDRIEEEVFVQSVQRYRAAWARPIFPPDYSFSDPLMRVLPEAPALEALGMVSVHLHSTASEGVMPGDAKVDELRAQVRELIDGVQVDEDIPDDLKHLIILRLQGVEDALEHLAIGGPSAVRHATEAVIGTVLMAGGPSFLRSPIIQKICSIAGIAWTVFSAPAAIENALEPWKNFIPRLTAAIEKPSESPEAPRPASPPADENGGTEVPTRGP